MEAIKTIYRKKKEGRGKLGARRERLASVNASREITIKIGGERLFAEKRRGKSGGNRSGRNIPADDSSQFSSDSSDRRDSFLSVKRSNVYRSVSYQSGASPIKTKPTTQEESNTRSFLTSTSDLFSPLPLSLSLSAHPPFSHSFPLSHPCATASREVSAAARWPVACSFVRDLARFWFSEPLYTGRLFFLPLLSDTRETRNRIVPRCEIL